MTNVTDTKRRDDWEIREDRDAIKRTIAIFKDRDRLKEVQEYIKSENTVDDMVQAGVDGDMQKALGFLS